ncbi:MAG: hypothetical protein GY834_14040 [Bacteroidetes bacterium]|nr:hypothetical protein [Bacteroidota bacterium]
MKRIINLIIIVLGLFHFSCERKAELSEKRYPYLLTNDVSQIDKTGVTFSAEVVNFGTDEIIDFGFMWSNSDHEFSSSLLKEGGTLDDFTLRISDDLENKVEYQCKPYIKTSENTVYGYEVTFVSEGIDDPIILDFLPKEGFDGTKITITGKYFSSILSKNKAWVNNLAAQVVYASTDTLIISSPIMSHIGDTKISIEVRSTKVDSEDSFEILGPQISSISTLSAHSGNYVTIYGTNLTQNGSLLEVGFGDLGWSIIESSPTEVLVSINPPSIDLLMDDFLFDYIKFVNGKKTTYFNQQFQLKASWSERELTPFNLPFEYLENIYNDKAYIFKAEHVLNQYTYYSDLYEYSPITDNWQPITDFPGENEVSCISLVFENELLVMGGVTTTNNQTSRSWSFNFINKTWIQIDDIPFTFSDVKYCILDNYAFITTDSKQVWVFNSVDKSFMQKDELPFSYSSVIHVFEKDGEVYSVNDKETWKYNINSDHWTMLSANPFYRPTNTHGNISSTGFKYKNDLYILFNGEKIYRYDIDRDIWIYTTLIPFEYSPPWRTTSTFTIYNQVFVIPSDIQVGNTNLQMFVYQN